MSKIDGTSLPENVFELLNKECTTTIVSTVSENGYPHALPVHLLAAKDSETILMALMKGHQSVKNIKNNGKTMITIIEGPDVALGIKGIARVVREPMHSNPAMTMIEFKVEEIKSDTSPMVTVLQGVHFVHRSGKTASFLRAMFDELKS